MEVKEGGGLKGGGGRLSAWRVKATRVCGGISQNVARRTLANALQTTIVQGIRRGSRRMCSPVYHASVHLTREV